MDESADGWVNGYVDEWIHSGRRMMGWMYEGKID